MQRCFFRGKKGELNILLERVIFFMLVLVFISMLAYFVYSSSTGANVYEQKYAKQIVLLIDEARPNMQALIDFTDGIEVAKENKKEEGLVRLDKEKNLVEVNLGGGGYDYHYFSGYEDISVYEDLENKVIVVKVGEKVFGAEMFSGFGSLEKPEDFDGAVAKSGKCGDYSEFVLKYSRENDINPVLILAIMMQESSCNSLARNDEDTGLMQINEIHCGTKELFSDKGKCKEQLKEPSTNIRVGAEILREYIDYSRKTYEGKIKSVCKNADYQKKYLSYGKLDSAIRLYNGPGCSSEVEASYVEKINKNYASLGGESYA